MEFKLPENNAKAALVVATLATVGSAVVGTLAYFFGPAVIVLAGVFLLTFIFSYIFIDMHRWGKGR